MKILLLNNNPVVSKLVTLSANKTSDELDSYETIEEIKAGSFDLLVVDDSLYNEDVLAQVKNSVTYAKTLYIYAKNAPVAEEFDVKLKKPFLPTDLVELFSVLGKDAHSIELGQKKAEETLSLDDNFSLDDELSLDDLGDDFNLDDELELDDDDLSIDGEEFSLDDELLLDEEINTEDSVLDEEEVQEVQELLDETDDEDELTLDLDGLLDEEDDELSLDLDGLPDDEMSSDKDGLSEDVEDELSLDLEEESPLDEELSLNEEELSLEEELVIDDNSLEEELELESNENLDSEEEISLEDESEELESDDLILDEEMILDDEEVLAEEEELSFEEEDLESQIESALNELSEEDLESEVDAKTLVDLASSSIDSIDSLNIRELKLALGEDISDLPEEIENDAKERVDEGITSSVETTSNSNLDVDLNSSENEGVEALKNLLLALSDKNVAASLKGMNISINITLGDK